MTDLQIFKSADFGEVRTVLINGEPMFCLTDICRILDIRNVSDCKNRLIKNGVGTTEVIDSLGRKQNATFINEANLYKVIFQSRKEEAEKFTEWVTSEVLPTIRKTGSYQAPMSLDEQIKLVAKGYVDMSERMTVAETKLNEVKIEIDDFKASMTMTPGECDELQKSVKKRVVELLGGKDTEAYMDKSLRTKVFTNCWKRLKEEFGIIGSYKHIKSKNYDIAKNFIEGYTLTFALQEEVDDANAQMRLEA